MNPKAPGCVTVIILTVVIGVLVALGIVPFEMIFAPGIGAVALIGMALVLIVIFGRRSNSHLQGEKMIAKKDVLKYFRVMSPYYIDPHTGEMNATFMAEDAVAYFNVDEDFEDYENIYDWAAEYAIEHNGY